MALTPDPPTDLRDTAETALAELVHRYRRPLLAYFNRRVSGPAEAEDLVQDVFERVLRGFDAGVIGNAEALLFRIAVNLLRDRARRLQRHGTELPLPADAIAEFADALTEDLSLERVVIGERTLAEVQAALDELGERGYAPFPAGWISNQSGHFRCPFGKFPGPGERPAPCRRPARYLVPGRGMDSGDAPAARAPDYRDRSLGQSVIPGLGYSRCR